MIINPVIKGEGGGFQYASNAANISSMFFGRHVQEVTLLPETLDMTGFDNVREADSAFAVYQSYSPKPSCKNIIFKFDNVVSCSTMFRLNTVVETITFLNGISLANNSYGMFFGCTNLRAIYGEIKVVANLFSMANNQGPFYNCTALEHIEFGENIIGATSISQPRYNFAESSMLNDGSLVSIANGLCETATGQTLTLHATPKARCSTIMGTSTLDPTSTYHVFTADPTGTLSLADFITTVKGWTLA